MSKLLSWKAKHITCCTCDIMSMLHSLQTDRSTKSKMYLPKFSKATLFVQTTPLYMLPSSHFIAVGTSRVWEEEKEREHYLLASINGKWSLCGISTTFLTWHAPTWKHEYGSYSTASNLRDRKWAFYRKCSIFQQLEKCNNVTRPLLSSKSKAYGCAINVEFASSQLQSVTWKQIIPSITDLGFQVVVSLSSEVELQ